MEISAAYVDEEGDMINSNNKNITALSILKKITLARYYILILSAFFISAGIIYMRSADKIYLVQMTVEAVEDPLTQSAEKLPTTSLATLFAPKQRDPLSEFRDQATSLAVSSVLFQDGELMKRLFHNEVAPDGSWREPSGLVQSIRDLLYSASNQPKWTEPSAQRVQALIKANVSFSNLSKSEVITVSIKGTDPASEVRLLNGLFEETDKDLKRRARVDIIGKIEYLEKRLKTAEVVEYRNVISDILIKSELKKIMLESAQPAIVSILDAPEPSEIPVWPKPMIVLMVALGLGAIAGLGIHAGVTHVRETMSQ